MPFLLLMIYVEYIRELRVMGMTGSAHKSTRGDTPNTNVNTQHLERFYPYAETRAFQHHSTKVMNTVNP